MIIRGLKFTLALIKEQWDTNDDLGVFALIIFFPVVWLISIVVTYGDKT